MFNRMVWLLLGLCIAVPAAALAEDDSPFLKQVHQHFDRWDRDKSGELSGEELRRGLVNPNIVGEEAAACAALYVAERDKKNNHLPVLTKDNITRIVPVPKKPKNLPDLQLSYDDNLAIIQKRSKREFFTEEKIKLQNIQQGYLGDCYLVSMIGWMIHNKPDALKSMFSTGPAGGVAVSFPSGKTIHINPLRDGELLFLSTNDDGSWLNCIEKAYGAYRNGQDRREAQSQPKSEQTAGKRIPPPFINVGQGGSIEEAMELFTGHKAVRIDVPEDRAKRDKMLEEFRKKLTRSQKTNLMIGIGTPPTTDVPGLIPGHAYAVLNYNIKKDQLKIWNPHGNSFEPTGAAGIENGYPTEHGIFQVPLDQAVNIFCALVFETNQPSEK